VGLEEVTVPFIRQGGLVVITGGMAGMKTNKFVGVFDKLQFVEDINFQLFVPRSAYRKELYGDIPRGYVVARGYNGNPGPCLPGQEFDDNGDLSDLIGMIDTSNNAFGFDDMHFLGEASQEKRFIQIVTELLGYEKFVAVNLLDKPYTGGTYGLASGLAGPARRFFKVYGVCENTGCDREGEFSTKKVNGEVAHINGEVKATGDVASSSGDGRAKENKPKITYHVRCRGHFEVDGVEEQSRLLRPPEKK
jgi:thymidine kinase